MSQASALSRGAKAARRRENIAGYIFMAPSLLFFLGFVIFPMGMCLVTSFFNYTMVDFSFIGLSNYRSGKHNHHCAGQRTGHLHVLPVGRLHHP